METVLLATKLYIPPPRPNLVSRPRLTERLNEGMMCKLTLISAPAGFGKTTLLSDWIHNREHPVAWVSLDEGDNDIARFLAYFIAALQTIDPRQSPVGDIGDGVLTALQSPQASPLEAMLTTLVNDIVKITDHFVLVLDDYHVIEASEIDQALTFLLDHLPPQMHLIIASRVTPSLPLSRLRARCEMTELRVDDLRFTPDEVAVFLNQMTGLEFSTENIIALENRTEGWIAGLQLAALSMQGLKHSRDVSSFIAAFTGSHRYVLDYLTDEVLQQCPPGTTDFLLQTSILKRLSGPLCNAVTGQDDSHTTLEKLDDANMFIVPLDNERHWYRYHHLFADLLQQRLQRAQPDNIVELHRRASQWYEQNNLVTEALDHALAAADFDRAARLVAQNAQPMFMRGEVSTVRDWFTALPPELGVNSRTQAIAKAKALGILP
jgi:LuxR family maltose regulon positive regulatory protein